MQYEPGNELSFTSIDAGELYTRLRFLREMINAKAFGIIDPGACRHETSIPALE